MYEVAVRLPLTTILVKGPLEKLIEFFSRSPTSYYVTRTDKVSILTVGDALLGVSHNPWETAQQVWLAPRQVTAHLLQHGHDPQDQLQPVRGGEALRQQEGGVAKGRIIDKARSEVMTIGRWRGAR